MNQFKNNMKTYLIVGISFFLFSCKKEIKEEKVVESVTIIEKNNCLIDKGLGIEKNQLIVGFDDFNVIFNNVISIDNPNSDFDIKNDKEIITIHRKFLESDFLGDNEFFIQSSLLDSISISCLMKNDFIFYGQEKKRIPLNLSQTKEKRIVCENGRYKVNEFRLDISSDVYKVAKLVNKKHSLNVLNSDSYGDIDKKEWRKSFKKIEENVQMSFEELFIEEGILLTTYTFECYKNKTKFQKKLIISNRFK
ncbi:hypothetical protein J2Q11_12905 [Tenacibaculum finnmarkense genomovar finnmarkense]|uniref:hypothetical protein n=1 Tax=Tenacibaculum finnmarkense TaxID=2781243 RepID=UPI001E47F7D4|nr:hypothetical protein [Tenacibaculum finnmarkense]MCD8418547.1 hypothetical protein [Tenacibaculum finnmarkense genomovar finnmarkense]MCG8186900.1 hypothetical protein [Tenacibaculum finnmarkense genomovar finnmarkense]MCG8203437.1 hypothetical protein [Tenacibaculum finnmarkense genomovar finnmarkense]MCG8210908.1 hypothetical protein [Tenacibaculum finnmarkense genomovar finnmarkense]MCG8213707.1 hypothetical protein [Tenacibaculum finnmarkense genomovar finnmarkense]